MVGAQTGLRQGYPLWASAEGSPRAIHHSGQKNSLEEQIPASLPSSPFAPTATGGSYIQGTSREREEGLRYPHRPSQRSCFLALPFVSPSPSQSPEHSDEVGGWGGLGWGEGLVLGEAALGQRCREGPGPRRLQSQQRFPGEQEGLAQLPGGQWNGLLAAAGGQGGGGGCLLPSPQTQL